MGLILIVAAIIIVIAFLIASSISQSKAAKLRNQAFADFAVKNGWEVIQLGSYTNPEIIGKKLNCDETNYSLFKYGSTRHVTQAISKQEGDKLYLVFDMKYSWSEGKSHNSREVTAAALCSSDLSLPKFALYPRGESIWIDAVKQVHYPGSNMNDFISNQGIHQLLGYDDPLSVTDTNDKPQQGMHAPIKFDSNAFNERYVLHGKKTDEIKRFFEGRRLSILERVAPVCIDGYGACIFAFNAPVLVPPEQLQTFITEKLSVLDTLTRELDL